VTSLLDAVTGWVLFAGLVGTLGSLTARWILIPRMSLADSTGADADFLRDTAGQIGSVASVFLPVAMALVFYRQLREFRDPFVPWTEDASLLLTGTQWGGTWRIALAASIAAPILMLLARRGVAAAWLLATPLILALATFPALTGHAAGTEGLRALTLTADTIHVIAAGSWVGGLAFVLFAERRWRAHDRGGSLLPVLVPSFSLVAIVSVATLVLTGSLASWVHVADLRSLFSTGYGRLLLLKLGLVGAVMILGAVNWKRLSPVLSSDAGQDRLRRAATTELMVAQCVLIVTALLVRTSQMGH
jgi:putative copper resistance protein D